MAKSRDRSKQKIILTSKEQRPYLFWSICIPVLIVLLVGLWHYRAGISYYVSAIFKADNGSYSGSKKHDARNVFLMSEHADRVFGIDISQYQSDILWDSVRTIHDRFPVDFVFVRATMGAKAKDSRFKENWKSVANISKLRGAYHYYRPNENSLKQAKNFMNSVKLSAGDLPPVLDIEERPKHQSMDSLRVGLKRWLETVEAHYGIRPIIYSGDSYYTDFLHKEFNNYVLWIANYNFWVESPKDHWDFWQFSEKGYVKGIKGPVDLNMYKGSIEQLENLCIPYKH